MSEIVRVINPETGDVGEVPATGLMHWTARGWEVATDEVREPTLADHPVPVITDKDSPGEGEPEPPKATRVGDILAEVGDDPEKAAAALEAEVAGKARTTLVAALEAIVAGVSDI